MKALLVEFWAPYRGSVFVWVYPTIPTGTADEIARYAVESAVDTYAKHWPLPSDDRKQIVCVGISDDHTGVTK